VNPITDPTILAAYLSDASNLQGHADTLYRPKSTEEVAEIVAFCQNRAIPLTITARRTSTTGAPVPMGGALLSTEFLNRIHSLNDADAGILLGDYQRHTEVFKMLFPPDPTSRNDCSLGGAVCCNASGARTYRYGPTRPWIESVTLVTPTGEILEVDRSTPSPWPVPFWQEPAVKTAAGYYPAQNLLDLIIGSEGTLGTITRVKTRLIPLPKHVLTLLAWLPDEQSLLGMLHTARSLGTEPGSPRCIEYFDHRAIALIADRLSNIPQAYGALMFEIEHDGEPPLEQWFDVLSSHNALLDDTIVAEDQAGREKLHAVRHAVPAIINEIIVRNGVQKVGTDFSVPDSALPAMLKTYAAVPMEAVCFGHIGNNHLHLNLLPKNKLELEQARELYLELAKQAVGLGGSVSGEHGIGRLKKKHLALMAPPELLEAWGALRKAADPNLIFGRGVMIDPL
jgi:D-lactate dehydrogenase (cytochrome)